MPLSDLIVFLPAAILMAIPFGPSNFLCFSNALRFGAVPAGLAGGARIAGFGILIVLAAFGLGAVLAKAAWLLVVIKWFGVAYLAFLGWRIFRSPPPDLGGGGAGAEAQAGAGADTRRAGSLASLMRMEFTTAVANPKAILYFTAAFPQFIGGADNFTERFLVMGAVFLVCEWAVLWGYALAGSGLGRSGVLNGVRGWINRATGASFIGFAAWMAASR